MLCGLVLPVWALTFRHGLMVLRSALKVALLLSSVPLFYDIQHIQQIITASGVPRQSQSPKPRPVKLQTPSGRYGLGFWACCSQMAQVSKRQTHPEAQNLACASSQPYTLNSMTGQVSVDKTSSTWAMGRASSAARRM